MFLFVGAEPKVFGAWANDGSCAGSGEDKTCGPGLQKQKRTCKDGIKPDGSTDPCTVADREQSISCTDAGTALPVCVG